MSRSSDRGGVEPLAALAAVLAVTSGLAIYASVVGQVIIEQSEEERRTPEIALERAHHRMQRAGVVDPGRIGRAVSALPAELQANVTLATGQNIWSAGPTPPERAHTGRRAVGVRVAPGQVRPGTLRVAVWR